MKIVTVFECGELEALQPFILVECWKRVKQSGSIQRKYQLEFNEKERKVIETYYKIFSKWYLSSGIPKNHAMSIDTYQLMQRAIAFFANI